jgi:hypothetical protein
MLNSGSSCAATLVPRYSVCGHVNKIVSAINSVSVPERGYLDTG